MDDDKKKTLEDQLGQDDWAIVIDSNGKLKGLFIPDGSDEDEVPEAIIVIMEQYFGMNFEEEREEDDFWQDDFSETIH
ncbi:MAG: hypothetical protein VW551_08305 [Euryarchaeota archaeon]|jgi:hypothetical protein